MMTLDVALGAWRSEGEKNGTRRADSKTPTGDWEANGHFGHGMITCSTLSGQAVCRPIWGMDRAETQDYLSAALAGIPEGFSGRLLEVPVGTGILTMPLYRKCRRREITCLDYSLEMLERAKCRGEGLAHVRFQQGMWGRCPLGNSSFDIVPRLNGFHAFPTRRPPGGRSFVYRGPAEFSAAASMCGDKTAARTG